MIVYAPQSIILESNHTVVYMFIPINKQKPHKTHRKYVNIQKNNVLWEKYDKTKTDKDKRQWTI